MKVHILGCCRHFTCHLQQHYGGQGTQLYMVLDGNDGTRAVECARLHIPHCLLTQDLSCREEEVVEALRSAILFAEREFFAKIDDYISRKLALQKDIEVHT